ADQYRHAEFKLWGFSQSYASLGTRPELPRTGVPCDRWWQHGRKRADTRITREPRGALGGHARAWSICFDQPWFREHQRRNHWVAQQRRYAPAVDAPHRGGDLPALSGCGLDRWRPVRDPGRRGAKSRTCPAVLARSARARPL